MIFQTQNQSGEVANQTTKVGQGKLIKIKRAWLGDFRKQHAVTISSKEYRRLYARKFNVASDDVPSASSIEKITIDCRPGVTWQTFMGMMELLADVYDFPVGFTFAEAADNIRAVPRIYRNEAIRKSERNYVKQRRARRNCIVIILAIFFITTIAFAFAISNQGNSRAVKIESKFDNLRQLSALKEQAEAVSKECLPCQWTIAELNGLLQQIENISPVELSKRQGQIKSYLGVCGNFPNSRDFQIYDQFESKYLEQLPSRERCLYPEILELRGIITVALDKGNPVQHGSPEQDKLVKNAGDAEQEFRLALSLPSNKDAKLRLTSALGVALSRQGKYSDAIPLFNQVLETLQPNDLQTQNLRFDTFLFRAETHLNNGSIDLAVRDLEAIFSLSKPESNTVTDLAALKLFAIYANAAWKDCQHRPNLRKRAEVLRGKVNSGVLKLGKYAMQKNSPPMIRNFLEAVSHNILHEAKFNQTPSIEQLNLAEKILASDKYRSVVPPKLKVSFKTLRNYADTYSIDTDESRGQIKKLLMGVETIEEQLKASVISGAERSSFALVRLSSQISIVNACLRNPESNPNIDLSQMLKDAMQGLVQLTTLPKTYKTHLGSLNANIKKSKELAKSNSEVLQLLGDLSDAIADQHIEFR